MIGTRKSIQWHVILPILFLLLSIFLDHRGDIYRNKIVDSITKNHDRLFEPVPENVAWARVVDYAINAPAWLLWSNMPSISPMGGDARHRPIIRTLGDIWYLFFVLILWSLIGFATSRPETIRTLKPSWLRSLLGLAIAAYGAALCYVAIHEYFPPKDSALWFVCALLVWGASLILSSVFFFPDKDIRWRLILYLLGAFYGILVCYFTLQTDIAPHYRGRLFTGVVCLWGGIFGLVNLLFLSGVGDSRTRAIILAFPSIWITRTIAVLWILYSVLLSYTALQAYHPLCAPWDEAPAFGNLIFAWGVCVNVIWLYATVNVSDLRWFRGLLLGEILYGASICYIAISLNHPPFYYGQSLTIAAVAWGSGVALGSIYFLTASTVPSSG